MSASPVPDSFSLAKDGDEKDAQAKTQGLDGVGEQILAADYDPNLDRREDERRLVMGTKDEANDVEMIEEEEEEDEEDDVDDMFAVDKPEKKKVKKVRVVVSTPPVVFAHTSNRLCRRRPLRQL